MLTSDLVRAKKKGGELIVRPLSAKERPRALELASTFLEVLGAHVGASRADVDEALSAIPVGARERKLADGLLKLLDDACEFSMDAPADPVALRSEVFLAATAARASLGEIDTFDRAAVMANVAEARGMTADALERAIYADLRSEAVLAKAPTLKPEVLVHRYDAGQVQAVLLRAVRVVAVVSAASPEASRALFRALKFRRLLHKVERSGAGYRIEIDGPYSMFESVTKYGLELALVLPALEACGKLSLVAEVRWGKTRESLAFKYEHDGAGAAEEDGDTLRDDVAALLEGFGALDSQWKARAARDVLELRGVGLCVPDLVFEHRRTKKKVFFEALGFWSRDAAWKRVELVKAGLPTPILFAVSTRLRVSETVLDDTETAALYVYKGVMSARAVERKLDALAGSLK
jgi:predicted nuclease of restriction endonuclease-like RecB superfamily